MKNGSTKHPCTCACIYHVPIAGISNCINLLSTINFSLYSSKNCIKNVSQWYIYQAVSHVVFCVQNSFYVKFHH